MIKAAFWTKAQSLVLLLSQYLPNLKLLQHLANFGFCDRLALLIHTILFVEEDCKNTFYFPSSYTKNAHLKTGVILKHFTPWYTNLWHSNQGSIVTATSCLSGRIFIKPGSILTKKRNQLHLTILNIFILLNSNADLTYVSHCGLKEGLTFFECDARDG